MKPKPSAKSKTCPIHASKRLSAIQDFRHPRGHTPTRTPRGATETSRLGEELLSVINVTTSLVVLKSTDLSDLRHSHFFGEFEKYKRASRLQKSTSSFANPLVVGGTSKAKPKNIQFLNPAKCEKEPKEGRACVWVKVSCTVRIC